MTDKTDIEALRDKHELALKDLTERLTECNRLNFCMDELSAFAAFSSTVIDQLEAERQRADKAESYARERDSENESIALTVGRLRLELAELRGEILSAEQEINWPIAQKVRAALDRVACPDAFMRIAVEACTDAFRGEQEPVAYLYKGDDWRGNHAVIAEDIDDNSIPYYTPLFSSPQAPLVVTRPPMDDLYHNKLTTWIDGFNYASKGYDEALKAAGIVVKDGE